VGSPGRRQILLLAAVAVVLVAFAARLLQVQAFDGQALAADAFDGRLTTDVIPAERGEILDRNGEVLATSVERWNIVVDQPELAQWKKDGESAAEAAAALAPLLGISAPELGPKLIGDRSFVYLAKGVVPEVYEQITELGIRGVFGERTSERLYPNGATAGNLLGFVGTDGYGLAGLEQAYDETLSGEDGSDTYEEGARGQRIPTGSEEYVAAVAGQDVQLTIDRDLQDIVERLNDEQVAATGSQWGTIQVTDVRTGEILALADSGSIDPNDPQGNAAPSRAVSYTYEPGSTAKAISMAAILDTGVATPTTPFIVPDAYTTPNGETFHDSHEHPDLPLTLTGILAESSNAGTVMVGQAVPPQVRRDYLAKFGFGSTTGIGLPGETAGLLADDAEDWDGRSAYTVLFGQAVGVTTVQNTQVFATLANHGVRLQPHIVAAVEGEDGAMHPVELAEPQQVVSAETADTVVRMLESAVTEGTGGNAAVPGYRIAGKTGTAQAFEGDGVIKVVASFIGIAPADDPRIVVNVVLYDPQSSVYGGTVAAPVFSEVTAYALRYLGVPPSGTPAEPFPTTHG
jgi:cell division protein FtsI (penicillin-binding protein 3)